MEKLQNQWRYFIRT